ncbi:unnamed protein product [Orchesella dallaii]|uniref:Uncharacterized protein n=1 Tax=Orchesella dallaii TaxID=48710 RepID=A0ABP1S6F7_9HEXA
MGIIFKLIWIWTFLSILALVLGVPNPVANSAPKSIKTKVAKPQRVNMERYDDSINEYLTERTCWFSEMCKEEFSTKFRCRCPLWSYCSSPGKYYNAYCTMSGAGYLWTQPKGFFWKNNYNSKLKRKVHGKPPVAGRSAPSIQSGVTYTSKP